MINQNWVFGNNSWLDFTSSPPTPISGAAITTWEGCASISDSAGNLLFYTDGKTVWDSSHNQQVTGLLGNSSSTQSAIIVPNPGNNQQYYVFTADGASGSDNHFNGGLVDLSTSTWSFTSLSGLMTLPNTTGYSPVEKITAIQHKNCKDFWVLTLLQKATLDADSGPGILRVFLVNSSGVNHVSDISLRQNIIDYGYMKGSSDGSKLAIANYGSNQILVFPFDSATGTLDVVGGITINTSTNQRYGLEFSPNCALLYYSDVFTGPIYQVDLMNSGLASTAVGNVSTNTGALQLGIDNKIYISKYNQNSLAAILDPDIPGLGCNVNNTYVTLPPGAVCQYGLPNLIANPCSDENDCQCKDCNGDSSVQNDELIQRAVLKTNTVTSTNNSPGCPPNPFPVRTNCRQQAIISQGDLKPCFYFHWGDGSTDQIEEHDTEVFYITVCNNFNDILFKGLKITKVTLNPNHPISSAQIVPDRLVNIDCLEPCSCQTREFAIITRDTNIAGNYTIEIEYCFDEIVISSSGGRGRASFPFTITED